MCCCRLHLFGARAVAARWADRRPRLRVPARPLHRSTLPVALPTSLGTRAGCPEYAGMTPKRGVSWGSSETRRTGCTMGMLRKSRRLWAVRHGHCEPPDWDWETAIRVGYLLERRTLPAPAP